MTRRLTREERALWAKIEESVRPLRPRPRDAEASATPPPPEAEPQKRRPAAPPALPNTPPRLQNATPNGTLDPKLRRRLSRGLADVAGTIDLHGMRQERAYASLLGFLRRAQLRGDRVVLVITGKGRDREEGRGVLRHAVPLWFASPEFRGLVAGYEAAGRRHGGEGALYVRLRRRA